MAITPPDKLMSKMNDTNMKSDAEAVEISVGDIVQAHNGLGPCEIIEGPLYRMKSIASSAEYVLKEDEFHLRKKKNK